jgi:hypothetical protein
MGEMSQYMHGSATRKPLKQAQMSLFFSFTKSKNTRVEHVLPLGIGASGRGEEMG